VKAQVLGIDTEKRQIKLSMKQLIPTSIDEYIAEHKPGDVVSGRVIEAADGRATVELGEGIRCTCRTGATGRAGGVPETTADTHAATGAANLTSLTSMLQSRWKGNAPAAQAKSEPMQAGQIRSFKIVKLNLDSKQIEVELA
jgi:small subunit ribosomal protein S1